MYTQNHANSLQLSVLAGLYDYLQLSYKYSEETVLNSDIERNQVTC